MPDPIPCQESKIAGAKRRIYPRIRGWPLGLAKEIYNISLGNCLSQRRQHTPRVLRLAVTCAGRHTNQNYHNSAWPLILNYISNMGNRLVALRKPMFICLWLRAAAVPPACFENLDRQNCWKAQSYRTCEGSVSACVTQERQYSLNTNSSCIGSSQKLVWLALW